MACLMLGFILCFSVSSGFAADPQFNTSEAKAQRIAALIDKAQTYGSVPVILQLNASFTPEGELGIMQAASQRNTIAGVQNALISDLSAFNTSTVRQYQFIPFMALTVDAAGLSYLQTHPDVLNIKEDRINYLNLYESVPLINGDDAWALGYTGAGQTVAIIDTGVESSHSFLTGKVVSEACYLVGSGCPNGKTSQTGTGAAANPVHSHGTHVSGIAAGTGGTYNSSAFSGVAKGADIIAIRVCYNTSCYDSDMIAGFERVYALKDAFTISSANMSIGGDRYYDQATCDADHAGYKAIIDNLRSAGIASVISSGNDYYKNSMGSPGCVSSAISVGATTKADAVADFSNSASFLSLLAPGVSIYSSVMGGGFESWNGTSMAAPHVTGAWAVMKQKNPYASVSTILAAFQSTGTLVTDTNSITIPRINISAALAALPLPVQGVCGLSNGKTLLTPPTTGLCSSGTAGAVIGTGPWTWTCEGLNGAPGANCSANKGFTIKARAKGTGAGAVTSTPAGIGFAYPKKNTKSSVFVKGSKIVLKARANAVSRASWYGTCKKAGGKETGDGTRTALCTINHLTKAVVVTAIFNKK